jgi:hypothetical protein
MHIRKNFLTLSIFLMKRKKKLIHTLLKETERGAKISYENHSNTYFMVIQFLLHKILEYF